MAIENRDVVRLGGREFVARALPLARIRALAQELAGLLGQLAASQAKTTEEAIAEVLARSTEGLYRFLQAFIPELPQGILDDPDNGPTLPEIVEAIRVIARLNRFDTLVGALGPFGRALQTAASRMDGS